MRAVGRDDRDAAGLEAFEYLALGVGDGVLACEMTDVGGCDGGDDGDVGADEASQVGEFACVIHTHLEHAEAGRGGHAGEAQGNADVVVVALDRAVREAATAAVQSGVEGFLDAGLAS